jgi:hypothetical protein
MTQTSLSGFTAKFGWPTLRGPVAREADDDTECPAAHDKGRLIGSGSSSLPRGYIADC